MESFEEAHNYFNGEFHSGLKQQMTSVVAMILARKMRVNLPDNSGLILQSICQTGGKPNPGQPQAAPLAQSGSSEKHPTYVRRYSTPQEDGGDTFDSNSVLRKFTSTLQQSAARLTHHGAENANIYSNYSAFSQDDSHTSTSTTSFTQAGQVSLLAPTPSTLSRVQSTPHLASMPHHTNYLEHQQGESSVDSTTGALSRSIRRNQSQGDLLQVTEYNMGGGGGGSSGSDQSSKDNKAIASMSTQLQKSSLSDMPDSSDSSQQSGFGILSRTRQFGAWLTKATDGEKVEVTKKDLNVLAPNSF